MLNYVGHLAGLFRRAAPFRLAVVDDLFPQRISGFRFEEYGCYLDAMPGVSIHTNGQALGLVGETRPIEAVIAEHVIAHPRHLGRVLPLGGDAFPEADAYYTIFLNNIAQYVEAIERTGKPFAFTLYPGGGFGVDDAVSDKKLRRVCASPAFRQVIVTQPIARDYLVKAHGVPASKIEYLKGGMVPRAAFVAPPGRNRFGIDKASLDIGFVANRYTPMGEDKGYDLFVETARALSRADVQATYHVVGPWDANTVPLGDCAAQFTFHGFVSTEKLRALAQGLDLVLSPNRPDTLSKGAFDGFPTGSCVECGLQEAAIFCTDVLKLNTQFRDGIDLVIVEPNVEAIVRQLLPLIHDPHALAKIGWNGRDRLTQVFGRETQLPPRLAMLRNLARC